MFHLIFFYLLENIKCSKNRKNLLRHNLYKNNTLFETFCTIINILNGIFKLLTLYEIETHNPHIIL